MKLVRSLFWMSLYVVGLIGVVHVTYTFEIFDELSQEAIYFVGTGLGVVVLVLFNYAIWRVPRRVVRSSESRGSVFCNPKAV